MRLFRDIPIKQKLMAITMLIVATALVYAGVALVLSDVFLFRDRLQHDLAALAQIVADNSTAALAFDDPQSARETLAALKVRAHVVGACIYRENGSLLARYSRPGAPPGCASPTASQNEMKFTRDEVTVLRLVMLKGRRVGTLVLVYDLGEIYERIRIYGAIVVVVLLLSSLIAFLLSSKLREIIATPISKLAEATTSVSQARDYSIRARKYSNDELGILVDGFNSMLAGIQSRDSELRQALAAREAALREAHTVRDSLKTTLTSIGDAVISTDADGRIVFINPVAQSLLRWPEAEAVGRHLDDIFCIVNENTRAKVDSPAGRVLKAGITLGLANHTVLIARDGTEIPIDDSGAPIRDEAGVIQGAVLVFRDVTGRRRAEETSRLLASIVESSGDGIISYDLSGNITSWNRGAERIFGYLAEEMIGSPLARIAVPGHEDDMTGLIERIKQGDRIEAFHTIRRAKGGTLVDVSLTVSPLKDAEGRVVGISKICRDIGEQVRAAERLAQANSDLHQSNLNLARSNEDLERFAFVASHDLQEPLRMITTYAQLFAKTHAGLESDATSLLHNIVDATKRMRELLIDLLAYTELGADPEEPAQTFDMNSVLEKVRKNLQAAIDESGASIASESLPQWNGYEAHFISLFQNLIANAIKYRSEAPPDIKIAVQPEDSCLRFSVADNGIGIDPQYHEKIFGVFRRLHGKKIPGTGVGLAICQRVVERYGGHIWVDSAEGCGATFYFTLPDAGKQTERQL